MHEAAARLGLRQNVFRASRKAGLLPPTVPGLRGDLYNRSDIEAVRDRIGHRATYARCAHAIGLTTLAVEQLTSAGFLCALDDPLTRTLAADPHIDMRSAEDLVARLHRAGAQGHMPAGTIELREAVRSIGGRDKPWAPLVEEVLAGNFEFWIAEQTCLDVGSYRMRRDDLDRLRGLHFNREAHPNFEYMADLNQIEIADFLNISEKTLRELFHTGHLKPKRSPREVLVPFQAVLEFGEGYASISELMVRLSLLHVRNVWPETRTRGLQPAIGRHHWLRVEVDRRLGS